MVRPTHSEPRPSLPYKLQAALAELHHLVVSDDSPDTVVNDCRSASLQRLQPGIHIPARLIQAGGVRRYCEGRRLARHLQAVPY